MAQNWSDKSRALLKNQNFEILNNEICSIFPIDYLVFYVLDQNFDFLRKTDRFWANILYVQEFFWAESLQKTCLYVHEKLQRNPSVGSCLNFFIFRPYGFDYLEFLTNTRRGVMRSKTQWVFYRDLEWWTGPQKVQFWKTTGYPEVVGLILALLIPFFLSWN